MLIEDTLRDQMLGAVPKLRAFAISFTGHRDRADDLVQDTLLRAWANIDKFERGSNLEAWLFTILRNQFHSEFRKRRREVEDANGSYAARLKTSPEQHGRLDYKDFRMALTKLPLDQREALLLVGAQGMSYEEAAHVTGVAMGTIKSRVNRAPGQIGHLAGHQQRGGDRTRRYDEGRPWGSPLRQIRNGAPLDLHSAERFWPQRP